MVFKVGDRVKCVRIIADSEEVLGKEGIVKEVKNFNYCESKKAGIAIYVIFEGKNYWNIGSAALELLSTLTNEEVFWRNVEGNN